MQVSFLDMAWINYLTYLHDLDQDGLLSRRAISMGNLSYLSDFFQANTRHCQLILKGHKSITPQLLDEFQDAEKGGPLFFQYVLSQATTCQSNSEYLDLYLAKSISPEMDLSNETIIDMLCPNCDQDMTNMVTEWFKSDLNYTNVMNGNCSSNTLDQDSPVLQWCTRCWEQKDDNCSNCFEEFKPELQKICIMQKNPPTNWQYIDIFMSNFLSGGSKTKDPTGTDFHSLMTNAEQVNGVNVMQLWQLLNRLFLIDEFHDYLPQENLTLDTSTKFGFDNIAEVTQKDILTQLQSPKIHGDYKSEYVLIPFCSFGSESLKKCHFFKRQIMFYKKDTVCYTFNVGEEFNGGLLDQSEGLHFIVNYRLPRTKSFKPVQVIIHSANEIPDKDNTPATSMVIDMGKVVNVGVEMSITNITTSFAEMKESKRQCYLNIGEDASYSRNKCRMEQSLDQAKTSCNCTPWFLPNMSVSICDDIGLKCFDDATMDYLKSNPLNEECPSECVTSQYSLTVEGHSDLQNYAAIYDIDSNYGKDWIEYISPNNPLKYSDPKLLSSTSLVHVNFLRKEATVTLKDARVTIADMIGTIGGTFGVFIGLSFVGILEFFIWIWNWIKEMWQQKRKR